MPYGANDPLFDKDIGFYLFSLPVYVVIKNWALLALFLMGLTRIVLGHHVFSGVIGGYLLGLAAFGLALELIAADLRRFSRMPGGAFS